MDAAEDRDAKGKARALAESAIHGLGTTNAALLGKFQGLLGRFDAASTEEDGVQVLMEIMALVAQEQLNTDGAKQPASSLSSTAPSTTMPPIPEPADGVDAATRRVLENRRLLQGDEDVFQFVKGLVAELLRKSYVVVPRVLGLERARELAQEVMAAYEAGRLESGKLAGGRTGKHTKYVLEAVRGDKIGWFDDDPCHDPSQRDEVEVREPDSDDESDFDEEGDGDAKGNTAGDLPQEEGGLQNIQSCWHGTGLQAFSKRMSTIVQLMSSILPELKHISARSKAMVTCYPGNGARYIRHIDNPIKNGRKLTVLYYLNEWQPGDGGEIRLFLKSKTKYSSVKEAHGNIDKTEQDTKHDDEHAPRKGEVAVDIPPLIDTMVVFFSDERVPHEVLPTNKPRFAITHWFYDTEEQQKAMETMQSTSAADLAIEEERIRREIEKFEKRHDTRARVTEGVADMELHDESS